MFPANPFRMHSYKKAGEGAVTGPLSPGVGQQEWLAFSNQGIRGPASAQGSLDAYGLTEALSTFFGPFRGRIVWLSWRIIFMKDSLLAFWRTV